MQQAIVNLYADMGVTPGSLQPGLVPGAPDTQAPTSSIASPAQSASLPSGTPVTIAGTASDTGGGTVTKVEVSTNGGTTWSNATGTTSWTFAWTPVTQGSTVIRSRATDSSGNIEAPSGGVTVTVTPPVPDTTRPAAAITAPTGGATVAGAAVTISATASDNIGVAGVLFQVDGVTIGTEDTTSPYSIIWNTVGLADGSHALTAVARDAANNTGTSAAVTVTVVNGAVGPSVDATAFGDRASAATTVVTSAFSTTAGNELLLAFIGSDQATGTPITVTGASCPTSLPILCHRSAHEYLGDRHPFAIGDVFAHGGELRGSERLWLERVRRDRCDRDCQCKAGRAVGDAGRDARQVAGVRRGRRLRHRHRSNGPGRSDDGPSVSRPSR